MDEALLAGHGPLQWFHLDVALRHHVAELTLVGAGHELVGVACPLHLSAVEVNERNKITGCGLGDDSDEVPALLPADLVESAECDGGFGLARPPRRLVADQPDRPVAL